MKSILITGTKGKTTIAMILSRALIMSKKKVLCINSEGVFANGNIVADKEHYLKKYFTSPTVKALAEIRAREANKYDYLVAECSYASLGNIENSFLKNKFDVSVFTNLYWDHTDDSSIANRKNLFHRKLNLIRNTRKGGYVFVYVGNKKNNIALRAIEALSKERPDYKLIAYNNKKITGFRKAKKCYLKGGQILFGKNIIFKIPEDGSRLIAKADVIQQSITLLAGLLKILGIDSQVINRVSNLNEILPGRLNIFSHKGYNIILDSAHESMSLTYAEKLLRKLYKSAKIIAVCRFSYQRTDDYIKKMAGRISVLFDEFIVYDKALSRGKTGIAFANNKERKNKPGYLARMINKILSRNKKSRIIYNEFEAIKDGIKKLKKGEVLYIMGDQIKKDLAVIKKELKKK